MKKLTLLFVVILFTINIKSQIIFSDTTGILIETTLDWWCVDYNPADVLKMNEAGVDVVRSLELDPNRVGMLKNIFNLNVIPIRVSGQNWIQHYTDAKYSVWEAEGVPPEISKVNLLYDTLALTMIPESDTIKYMKLKPDYADNVRTLIKGPYYNQDVYYYTAQDDSADKKIYYTASYKLKLEHNPEINPLPPDNFSDTLCILQVTQSTVDTHPDWHLPCTFVIDTLYLKRSDFDSLGKFKQFDVEYDLLRDDCNQNIMNEPQMPYSFSTGRFGEEPPGPRVSRDYIEFKVIWKGNPNYLISIDKIIVSDQRGRDLVGDINIIGPKYDILTQSNSLNTNHNYVEGWLGIDEPLSLDVFEPIRLVKELIESHSDYPRPLFIPFMGHWNSTWNQPENPFGSYGESPWEEFGKRVGNTDIIQDYYLFNYPYESDSECGCPDYRKENIRIMAELNYKQAYQLDNNFGVSIQCGKIRNTQATERDVEPHEILYNSNLALMYGAKILSLFRYFPHTDIDNCQSGLTCTGIVNIRGNEIEYTNKYSMLRYTLSPRLKGLMGKTLKKLTPTVQLLKAGYLITHNNILKLFINSSDPAYGKDFDLGFFKDADNLDYFMLINRWYNIVSPIVPLQFTSVSFGNYNNIQLYNLVDSSKTTVLNNSTIYPTIILGDALFYRVAPVVRAGGSLITNETTLPNETLLADMTIESGVILTVNGTYYANANITVKTGAKIIAGTNGKIIFANNKGLIIGENTQPYGTSAQIYGTPNNRLTLEFNSITSTGVEVRFYYALTMSYCDIKNAFIGINAENASNINISNVNFTNCQGSGIVLFSFGNGNSNLPSSTSTISKCIINGSSTGISVVNVDEVVITESSINNCNLGIYLNQVNSTHISSNNIIGYSYPNGSTMPGILMSSCGGYIRNNTIRYHKYGVQLAYSSPDMGLNTIEQNAQCGLFVDVGSFPNLIQKLVNENCWYPIAGCNILTNNGMQDGPPPMSTEINPGGSEIYLNYGDVKISSGGNEISDDRTNISSSLTLPLITGTRGGIGTRELYADRNYWGSVGPSSERFGRLNVIYEPDGDFCPLPDAPCSGNEIIIYTSDGLAIDTLESKQRDPGAITTLEESYSNADKLFLSGEIEQAKIIYQQIVAGAYTSEEKLYAYNRLYEIGKLLREDDSYFTNLQTSFEDILSTETDTLLIKIYNQNAILCDIGKEEYLTAISKFDNIIQQNPNSEEAVYAEIDIITTALNLDSTNSQLGKMGNGKYPLKGTSD